MVIWGVAGRKNEINKVAKLHNQWITNFYGNGESEFPRTSGYGRLSSEEWCRERAAILNKPFLDFVAPEVHQDAPIGCVFITQYTVNIPGFSYTISQKFFYNDFFALSCHDNQCNPCSTSFECYQAGAYKPQMLVQPATETELGQTAHNCGQKQKPKNIFYFPDDLNYSPELTNISLWRDLYDKWINIAYIPDDSHLERYTFQHYLADRGWDQEYNENLDPATLFFAVGLVKISMTVQNRAGEDKREFVRVN